MTNSITTDFVHLPVSGEDADIQRLLGSESGQQQLQKVELVGGAQHPAHRVLEAGRAQFGHVWVQRRHVLEQVPLERARRGPVLLGRIR